MALSKKEILELRKAWGNAPMPEDTGAGWDIPDGKYQFKILSAEIGKSGNGRLQATMEIECVGGAEESIGEGGKIFDGLETAENIGWFKRKLARLGYADYDLDDFGTIEEIVEGIAGTIFEGQVKHKDGYMNVYANKLVSGPGESEESEEEESKPVGKKGKPSAPAKPVGPQKGKKVKPEPEEEEEETEEEETEEAEEEAADRNYPTLDEIGKMGIKELQAQVLDDFGVELPKDKLKPGPKNAAFVRELAKAVVAIMEDDDHKAPREVLEFLVTSAGKVPKKNTSALEAQVLEWLTEISG